MTSPIRSRWAAVGAAIAVSLGAGGISLVGADQGGDSSVYTAIESCRVTDTRPNHGIGGRTTPLGPGETHTIATHGSNGQCTGIPTDAVALNLNVTALLATELTHLTIWPEGPVPNASSLNPSPGQPPVPNAVTTKLADDGSFKIFNNSGSVHVIVDIVGIYRDHDHTTEKIIPIDLRSLYLRGGASHMQGSGEYTGVRLPDSGTSEFDFLFRLPGDYVTGDTITAEIWWHVDQATCTAQLDPYYNSLSRPGMVNKSFSVTALPIRESLTVPANVVRRWRWRVNPPPTDEFRPGDMVSLDFYRNTSDQCTEYVVLDNIFVQYG